MKESDLEREFGAYVRARGGLYLKQNPAWYANIPDRLVLVPGGLAFFLEWKMPGCTLRPGQVKWGRMARARGHLVYRCDDIELAKKLYEEYETRTVSLPTSGR